MGGALDQRGGHGTRCAKPRRPVVPNAWLPNSGRHISARCLSALSPSSSGPNPPVLRFVLTQNLLACSLHEQAYEHDPGFRRFVTGSGLLFRAHAQFKKADLDARQELYRRLAERIWSPDRLAEAAS